VSTAQRRHSLGDKSSRVYAQELHFKPRSNDEERLLGRCVEIKLPHGKKYQRKHHVRRKKVLVKKCGKDLVVGVDIKFSPLINSLDGQPGIATVFHVTPKSPGDRAGLKVGDRILSVFNVVAHTKAEFFGVFAQHKALQKTKNVPLFVEKPCKIAKLEAQQTAESYIAKNFGSPVLRTAGFKCKCTHCEDVARFLCRDSPMYVDSEKHAEEKTSRNSRRHSIDVARNHTKKNAKARVRAVTLCVKSSSQMMIGKKQSSGSKSVSLSSSKGSRSNLSWNSDSDSSVELQHVFSFTDLANRNGSKYGRRVTIS